MSKPCVKVMLDDGSTWVTVVYLDHPDLDAAVEAAGRAFAIFISSLIHTEERIERYLKDIA